MKASQRKMITASVAILIVIVGGLIVRNCGKETQPLTSKSGDSITYSSINWTVVSVMRVKSLQSSAKTVTANGWFMVVDLYLENTGKTKMTFDPDSLILMDGTGKEYPVNESATANQVKSLSDQQVKSIFGTTLEPGEKQRLVGVFEISESATKMKLKVLGSKYDSNRDLVISLGF